MKTARSGMIPRLYMKLLPIQIVLVIIGGLNAVIDNAFAANLLGADAMAVTGLFSPVSNLLNAVNTLFFGGAQILCGKYLGKQMADRTGSIFSLDVAAVLIVSVALSAVCEAVPGLLGAALGASPALIGDLSGYIRGFAFGLPFLCLGTQFTAFLQLEHQEKRTYAAIGAMFILNIIFNWLFIAVFRLGLFGLGLSTSAGYCVFCVIQAFYYLSGRSVIRFGLKSISFPDLKDILVNGIPGAVSQGCIFARGILMNRIIGRFVGSAGLAAYSAICSFGCVYWAVPAGVTSAVMVLGSVFAGEEDRTGLRELMRTFLSRGVGLVAVVSLALSACCVPLTRLFFRDPAADVYRMTLAGFMLFPLSSPLSAFTVGLSNYYHCIQRERIVRIISVIDGIAGVFLSALALVPLMGMNGVWAAQIVGCALSAAVLCAYAWKVNGKPVRGTDDLMCYPEGFGVPDEDRIDIPVRSMDEVISLSRTVWAFCEARGIDSRRRNCVSLCVEELAGNIVRHGFGDGKKHSLDIRVTLTGEDVRLCLKDDCRGFDPTEASKLFDPDDKAHNIGLRIAAGITRSMTYQNTFGLNILQIVV